MLKFIRNILRFKSQVLLVVVVLIMCAIVLVNKAPTAITGILWGKEQALCSLGINSYCKMDLKNIAINFGVYDPQKDFESSEKIAIEHIYYDWSKNETDSLVNDIDAINSRNRWPMVTVEPFGDRSGGLLPDITKGVYDEKIETICKELKKSSNPVFIRFAHEMENVTGRYPWASENSSDYVLAYKHFVDECKKQQGEFYYVWSPAGNDNLAKYWPGKEYADCVGLSLYSFDEYEMKNLGHTQGFNENFGAKYNRVKDYERPVIVAEMGINDKSLQSNWLNEMYTSLDQYPLLKSAVYFNSVDSLEAWGTNYSVPDWKISAEVYP